MLRLKQLPGLAALTALTVLTALPGLTVLTRRTALVVVGRVLGARGGLAHDGVQAESYERSKLYDPSFATGYRKASS